MEPEPIPVVRSAKRVTTPTDREMSDRTRAALIAVAGVAIILLGAAAALLPVADRVSGSLMIGSLLVIAGIVELLAGSLRRQVRNFAMAAGAITSLTGLLFIINPTPRFTPLVTLVIGWLLIRSLILAFGGGLSIGSVRSWMALSAGMDFLLAMLLITGLSIATIVINLFGPTAPLIASFSWILAASFVVTGTLLLEVATCERETSD
jgi:uncharacterized membrane protein HdeD (DUF308 family)